MPDRGDGFGEKDRTADQAAAVGQITVMQDEVAVGNVRVLVEMVDAIRVEQRTAALDAMHFITFFQKKFSQIGTVLSSNTCY